MSGGTCEGLRSENLRFGRVRAKEDNTKAASFRRDAASIPGQGLGTLRSLTLSVLMGVREGF